MYSPLQCAFQRTLLSLAMGCALFAPVHAAETESESAMKQVAITAIVEHPALDSIRRGVEDELVASGYQLNQTLQVQYQSAQGSSATAAQIAKQFAAAKPDVMVGIATPSAQALAAASKTVPVVFSAVTDPVAAKLVKEMTSATDSNITGVSDALPLEPQIELMLRIKPDLKTVGYVYSPGEVNSTVVLKNLQAELKKRQIEVLAVPAQRTSDVSAAARSLKGKVDLIYTTTDNNVVSAYEAMVKVAVESKIPLIASDPDSVRRGAVAALGMDQYQVGRQTGKLVARILKGEKPSEIVPEFSHKTILVMNPTSAERQGLVLSSALIESADEIVGSKE